MQVRIIAIETSGRRGSAALGIGQNLVAESTFSADMEHARDLIPMIDQLCHGHDWPPKTLGHCYLSIGPGSFTGLRIAVTFARHLALAADVRICAVPTLDVIAENCRAIEHPPQRLAVILDAKRSQVFAAVFQLDGGRYRRTLEHQMISPMELLSHSSSPIAVVGEGIDYHRQAVESSGAHVLDRDLWWPRAAHVHRLGWRLALQGRYTPPAELTPLYIRRPEAEELWEKRQGQQSDQAKN